MAKKTVTEQCEVTGRIKTGTVKKAKAGDFDVTVLDTRGKRIARALWG